MAARPPQASASTILSLAIVFTGILLGWGSCSQYADTVTQGQPINTGIAFLTAIKHARYDEALSLCRNISIQELKEFRKTVPFSLLDPENSQKIHAWTPPKPSFRTSLMFGYSKLETTVTLQSHLRPEAYIDLLLRYDSALPADHRWYIHSANYSNGSFMPFVIGPPK